MPKVRQKLAARNVGTSRSSRASAVCRVRNDSVAEDIVAATIVEYEKHGCASRGADMTRYMRGKFEYYGLYSGQRRTIDKKVCVSITGYVHKESRKVIGVNISERKSGTERTKKW